MQEKVLIRAVFAMDCSTKASCVGEKANPCARNAWRKKGRWQKTSPIQVKHKHEVMNTKLKITYSNQKKGDENAGCILRIEGNKEACLKALEEVKRQVEAEK